MSDSWPRPVSLSGHDVVLTPLRVDDADEVAAALDDPRLHEYTGGEPQTADQLRRRLEFLVVGRSPDGSEGWRNWVVRDRVTDEVVGMAQATLHSEQQGLVADVAWVIASSWQGRGLAKAAAQAVTSWLWRQGVVEIAAYIHPEHAASAAVARSVGLAPTATTVDGETRWVSGRCGA